MSLEIRIKNLGIIKRAEFSLGDLTILCGKNNTGKTYVVETLHDFLGSWRELIRFSVSEAQIQSLFKNDILKIGLAEYAEKADQMLTEACEQYCSPLNVEWGLHDESNKFDFHIQPGAIDIRATELIHTELTKDEFFTYSKPKGSEELVVVCNVDEGTREQYVIDLMFAEGILDFLIGEAVFSNVFPRPFRISSKRDAIETLREELDFDPSELLESILEMGQEIDPENSPFPFANPQEFLSEARESGVLPAIDEMNLIPKLADLAKQKSFIAEEHPEVLEEFADIIGGKYTLEYGNELLYIPHKGKWNLLAMEHSSSAVQSLADIGFYLHHIAQKDDLLIIDEPELGLHPENQCRIARLLARLVNAGVKVFITTHSDYIVKELNTLIMLNGDKPHLKRIAEENGVSG